MPRPSVSAAAVWDRHAARYPAQESRELRAVTAACDLAAPTRDELVVDLATGTGLVLRTLAARADPPRSAIGVDRSNAMLDRVGDLPPTWRTVTADARDVPLETGLADVVTISYLLHLLPTKDRATVLAEARRLLRPAPTARLIVVTVWTGRRPAARATGALLRALATAAPARLGGLLPLDPTADLQAAGFVPDVRVHLPRGGYPSLVLRARSSADPLAA